MNCPKCRHENEEGARYCEECAAPLGRACAKCGRPLSPTAKFCPGCAHPVALSAENLAKITGLSSPESYTPKHLAEKILTSRTALEGERKQVTVLFADLKGSMELLGDRDPEEARKILDPVLERMMEAVHRYEGTVNQVMGDGIMALFGAPVAHEDHAVRACYAALKMQENVKKYAEEVRRSQAAAVKIRVGVNSGEVVVRAIGSDLRMDYTAVGQTTHLAARMEQLADPGAIVMTPDTLALVEGYVEVQSLGPVRVKGLANAVEVFEVTGAGPARTRFQAAARRGLTRFVGRDTELDQLRRAQRLAGTGHGQIAAIIGEAGVGKSRLIYEFTHSHRLQNWLVLESASVSYGKATSYLPVIELLKGYFKIQDRDDRREMREKVTGKLVTLDRALEPVLPPLLALLDVPVDDPTWAALDPGQRRQRTFDAVKRLLLREAREQPLLVVLEDLHWIDSETQALLDGVVESLGSARLMLLVNYRPEYRHTWSGKTSYSQTRLDALPAESASELLEAILGDDPGLTPLKQLLVKRGNPFFLEETVRTLFETRVLSGEPGKYRLTQSVQTIQVPATVQVVLAARIDRLAPEDKRLLQTASVIGKDIPLALLAAIADVPDETLSRQLDNLQGAEFVYETGLYPDIDYTFKHALTHEVAYGGLLHKQRRELHGRIVDAIETLHRDRLGEHIERLAHHASAAELWEKAARYLRGSGQKALARSASQDAANYLEKAVAAVDHLPRNSETLAQACDVRLELRTALQVLRENERQRIVLTDALRLAEALGDQRRMGRALMYATLNAALTSKSDEALVLGGRAMPIAEALGDLELQVSTRNYLGITHLSRGNFVEARRLFEEVIARIPVEQTQELFGQARSPTSTARSTLGIANGHLGQFAEALAHACQALRESEAAEHDYSISATLYSLGVIQLLKGDNAEAVRTLDHSLESWRVLQAPPWSSLSAALGVAHCRTGDFSRGLSLLDAAQAHSPGDVMYPALLAQAEGYLLAGRTQQASGYAHQALDLARSTCSRGTEAIALWLLGEATARGDALDEKAASGHYLAALSQAAELCMRPLAAHCHFGLGKLHRRMRDHEQAQRQLTTAIAMYRQMGMTYWPEQSEAELRQLG
jgi:class 3 adenylate cyclase/tetratricopeptide (TPR) repeat protein